MTFVKYQFCSYFTFYFIFFFFFLDKKLIQSSPLGPFYAVFSLTCFKLKIKLFPD